MQGPDTEEPGPHRPDDVKQRLVVVVETRVELGKALGKAMLVKNGQGGGGVEALVAREWRRDRPGGAQDGGRAYGRGEPDKNPDPATRIRVVRSAGLHGAAQFATTRGREQGKGCVPRVAPALP